MVFGGPFDAFMVDLFFQLLLWLTGFLDRHRFSFLAGQYFVSVINKEQWGIMIFCTGAGFWRFIRHIYGSFLISERFQFLANWVLDMLFHSWLENIEKIRFSWLEIFQCIMLGVRYIFLPAMHYKTLQNA